MRPWLLCLLALAPGVVSAHPSEDEALARVEARLLEAPSQTRLHTERAEHLLRLMRPRAALDALEHAPDSAHAAVARARAYEHLDDATRARAALDHALDLDPRHAQARWRRATLRARAKDREGAIADLEVLRARPDARPDTFLRLGRLAAYPRARRALQEGLQRTGAEVLRRALVERALEAGDLPTALAESERRVAAEPASVDAQLRLADAQALAGHPHDAARSRARARALAEAKVQRRGSAAAYTARGRARQASGDLAGARSDAEAALARAPRYAPALALKDALR